MSCVRTGLMLLAAPPMALDWRKVPLENFRQIVEAQGGFYFGFLPRWHLFQGPMPQIVSFIIFMIAAFAQSR